MRNIKDIFTFEKISEAGSFVMTGGFSGSYYGLSKNDDDTDDSDTTANNCLGGNCHSSCGPFQNEGCNTTIGCGKG